MAEGDSVYTFNYVTDDPCYGCKFAVRKPDAHLPNPWTRRFGCKNKERRDAIVNGARIFLEKNEPMMVASACRALQDAVSQDEQFARYGYYDCEYSTIGNPHCYFKLWNEPYLDAVEEIYQYCDKEIRKKINTCDLAGFPFVLSDILKLASESPARRRHDIQNAKEILKKIVEIVQSEFDLLGNAASGSDKGALRREWSRIGNKILKFVPKDIRESQGRFLFDINEY